MKVEQIYELVNTTTKELLGEEAIVNEDLSNVVDIGQQFEDLNLFDNYVRTLTDHIGRVIFVNRVYKGRVPSVLKDGWEYGSIMEKISADLPEAEENESWELTDRASYDTNIFYKPSVSVSFWNDRVTFEIPISITDKQVKSAFSSATQMNAFVSMLFNAVQKSLTVKLDSLIMRTINNFIGETVYDDFGSSSLSSTTGIKAVNLLYRYNDEVNTGSDLTVAEALYDKDFLRFASKVMKDYINRIKVISTLFNVGGKDRFTNPEDLHFVMLSEFETAVGSYLYNSNGQFLVDNITLPNAETVPYWQGSGTDYSFSNTSKINIKTASGHTEEITGVIGFMFDNDALGVSNLDVRTKSHYVEKAEFTNYWYKNDAGFFNDLNENGVVFLIA